MDPPEFWAQFFPALAGSHLFSKQSGLILSRQSAIATKPRCASSMNAPTGSFLL